MATWKPAWKDFAGTWKPIWKDNGLGVMVPMWHDFDAAECTCCGGAPPCDPPCESCCDCIDAINGIVMTLSGFPSGICSATGLGCNGPGMTPPYRQRYTSIDGTYALTTLGFSGSCAKTFYYEWAAGDCSDPGTLQWEGCIDQPTANQRRSYIYGIRASVSCSSGNIVISDPTLEQVCCDGSGSPLLSTLCRSQGWNSISLTAAYSGPCNSGDTLTDTDEDVDQCFGGELVSDITISAVLI